MTQWHRIQHGIFLVTTNAQDREPWCVNRGVPEIIIETLVLAKRIQRAKVHAFCILPDHMHMIIEPGPRGLSKFVQSFKMNSSREIRRLRQRIIENSREDRVGLVGLSAEISKSPLTTPRKFGGGTFRGWQHGFHSQRIAEEDHLKNAFRYVERNALRHRLVHSAKDWPWTSIHFGQVMDR